MVASTVSSIVLCIMYSLTPCLFILHKINKLQFVLFGSLENNSSKLYQKPKYSMTVVFIIIIIIIIIIVVVVVAVVAVVVVVVVVFIITILLYNCVCRKKHKTNVKAQITETTKNL